MKTQFPKMFRLEPSWITIYPSQSIIQDIISSLLTHLIQDVPILESQNVIPYFLTQEKNHEAIIGDGIAFFHGYAKEIEQTLVTIARFLQPNSLWNQSIHTLFIIISPVGMPGQHLAALSQISKFFVLPNNGLKWQETQTSDQAYLLLCQ